MEMFWLTKPIHAEEVTGRCSQRGGIGDGLLLGCAGVGISVGNDSRNIPPSATRVVSLILVGEGTLFGGDVVHDSN